jgi:hypothetical protein
VEVLTAIAFGVPVQGVQIGATQLEKVVVAAPNWLSTANMIKEKVLPAATGMEAVPDWLTGPPLTNPGINTGVPPFIEY